MEVFSDTLSLATPEDYSRVLLGRGRAHAGLEQHEAADDDLSRALAFAQTHSARATILEWRSVSYVALELHQQAIDDLSAAYNLVRETRYLYLMGVLYQAMGEIEAATDYLTDFVDSADPVTTDPALLEDAATRLAELR